MQTTDAAQGAGWFEPPASPAAASREVHVWLASLRCGEPRLAAFESVLAPCERARAERFRFEKDRADFVVARGLLRSILSRYLRVRPEEVRFLYGPYGKPFLPDSPVRFNLAHSHGLALFAVAEGREVGVDLEMFRTDFPHMEVARGFFSEREAEVLEALPAEARAQAFFDCWTRKEAYIKARGEGLSHPLASFDVSLAPGEKAALLCTRGEHSEASRWSMHELSPAPGYRAALVAERHDYQLMRWRWQAPAEATASQL